MLWLKKKKKNLFKWDYDLGRFSGQKCHTKNPNPLENTCYLWTLSFFLCGLNLLNSRQSCLQWERQKAWEREREREGKWGTVEERGGAWHWNHSLFCVCRWLVLDFWCFRSGSWMLPLVAQCLSQELLLLLLLLLLRSSTLHPRMARAWKASWRFGAWERSHARRWKKWGRISQVVSGRKSPSEWEGWFRIIFSPTVPSPFFILISTFGFLLC